MLLGVVGFNACVLQRSGLGTRVCSTDLQCAPGQRCLDGQCVAGQEDSGVRDGGPDASDSTVVPVDGCSPTPELCDGVDNDCDPSTPDGAEDGDVGVACDGPDADACEEGVTACEMGAITCSDLSDDSVEVCGGGDEDCDGMVDEAGAVGPLSWYADGDADGYGAGPAVTMACANPGGLSETSDDCNDGNAGINPGATETCDGVDQDCDGATDEGGACPCPVRTLSGRRYMFCGEMARHNTWSSATTTCSAAGMALVRIDNGTENGTVRSTAQGLYPATNSWWLGMTRNAVGEWRWPGGDLASYVNWRGGEGTTPGQQCAVIATSDGTWLDLSCGSVTGFICEQTGS
ncbi:MAG: MopE-related protein [Sandaracinaceae bacterium]